MPIRTNKLTNLGLFQKNSKITIWTGIYERSAFLSHLNLWKRHPPIYVEFEHFGDPDNSGRITICSHDSKTVSFVYWISTSLLMLALIQFINGSTSGLHMHASYSRMENLEKWTSDVWFRILDQWRTHIRSVVSKSHFEFK